MPDNSRGLGTEQGDLSIDFLRPEEAGVVAALVEVSFRRYVAPYFGSQGEATFLSYASADGLRERLALGHWSLVAYQDQRPVGMIEVRDNCHVALFFVTPDRQRQGIGRQLLEHALTECRRRRPGLCAVDVNASPNAVDAYRKLGFRATDSFQEQDGIRYRPMQLTLGPAETDQRQ